MIELMRVEDVARRLNLSVPMVYRMAQRGQIPGVIRFGKAVRINVAELEKWLESRTTKPAGEASDAKAS